MTNTQPKRVIVGMSGGVDSSVTAALLKQHGYDVIGISLQLLEKEEEKQSACCNLDAIGDAKRVCAKLNIPHYTINSRTIFQERVINHFISQYLSGQTPNPCVECNRHIKFDELWNQAKLLNADYIATGHYCRRIYDDASQTFQLKKGKDRSKDQSYFLYMLTSSQLANILFPLGDYLKDDIRNLATSFGLLNADKPDSQEICFVGKQSYRDYISKRADVGENCNGDIVDTSGKKLGTHTGLYQFTIGQKKGLNLSHHNALYVLKMDPKTRTLVVGDKHNLTTKTISLTSFSLVDPNEPITHKTFSIKTRYQMTPISGTVQHHDANTATIETVNYHSFLAAGQSCVLYDADRIVGGGTIIPS